MIKAIGYIRVSMATQEISPEDQEAKIRAAGALHDCEIISVIIDKESGKNLKRDGAQTMMQMVVEEQIDCVIVAKLDRLTRSIRDLQDIIETFNKHNVSLLSVAESLDTHSASGRMVMNVMASVFQWERESIGERTSAALQYKKSQGGRVGNCLYGYRAIGEKKESILVQDEHEQGIIEIIKNWRDCRRSFQETANGLNEAGYTTRTGKPWTREGVFNIIRSLRKGKNVTKKK